MCGGPRKPSSRPSSPPPMAESKPKEELDLTAFLLELASSDDLGAFRRAVENENHPVTGAALWYGRSAGRRMSLEIRTPLMVAALYGSATVVSYILSSNPCEATRRSPSDGATPLHLAAFGGANTSLAVAHLLLAASADVDAVDAVGNRPGDLIPHHSFSNTSSLRLLLKAPSPSSSPKKEEKKEYPIDLTLPDIKNGIYSTDEFRMYTFKVKPCSRAYSHDWTECPFVHPGENARRRDPKKYLYSCVPCPEFRKGSCRNGDSCEYAHGVFESWLHPAQYRTRLCKDETGCNRRVCFFAHKKEELRTVNPATGLVVSSPSPRSSLDMAAAMLMMQQQQQQQQIPSSPLSPMRQCRLKASMSARDLEFDLDLLGLEGYQQKLIDEISTAASPRSNWAMNNLALDPSVLLMKQQSQLLSGYGGNLPASPPVSANSSFGLDHSMAKAIMNSRASAFAKRSQSFCDRGAAAAGRHSTLSAMTNAAAAPSVLSDWASPNGKLDWGIQGEELNKLRKSASFGFRTNQGAAFGGLAPTPATAAPGPEEPDFTWVHSLVKDGPAATEGRLSRGTELFSPWAEQQLYMEQEQMVA
ncbi:zinc finger CCCH domain-containing protein 33-like [Typha angustifolia]|uniref:zinc finger CCCH domain-containing protein 33-like n=1 Tax=Typha angustifolia TaxID=59011 RepID=UPI003C2CF51B